MCQSRFSCRTSRSRTIMRIILEVSVLALLPLAAFGTDSRLYRTDLRPSSPYQPPRPQYPSPQREDYYPPLAQHPQLDLSCCRSNYPGKMMTISKLCSSSKAGCWMYIQFPNFARGARLVSGERGLHTEGVTVLLGLRLLHPDHSVRPGWMFSL